MKILLTEIDEPDKRLVVFPAGFRVGCHPPQRLFRQRRKLLEHLHLIFFRGARLAPRRMREREAYRHADGLLECDVREP
ncbi:hypothetical protein ISP17_07535 [Dyella ginsengisoli]|uniref:Uncharacterized protein n=1 Tax=Dyella ginsengisoli TaxID=363848 RepID=A0ABW8JRR8_9GAMM